MTDTRTDWRPPSNTRSLPPWLSDAVPELKEIGELVRQREAEVVAAQRAGFEADRELEAAPNRDRRAAADAEGKAPAPTLGKAQAKQHEAHRLLQAAIDRRKAAWQQQQRALRGSLDELAAAHAAARQENDDRLRAALAELEACVEEHEFADRIDRAIAEVPTLGWELTAPSPGAVARHRARAEQKLESDVLLRPHAIGDAYELLAELSWRLGLIETEEEEQHEEQAVPA